MSQKIKKRKVNKTNLFAIIVSCIAILALICVVCGILVIGTLLKDKPTLSLQDFEQAESSIIYDSKGEEIANLGTVIRQNVEYGEIPNCVVDAFVAIEDSRFFEHNGFDLPRFTKALIENIKTMSFEQGGSTFTMQLVKNTYFTNDDTGEQASRTGVSGVRRKVQEIALAMELEQNSQKQFIFESYLNKLNYGGDKNIRGIQKAAQYYFGKDVYELNINEAALLAGVINAPNYYNPFYNPEAAQDREEEVLYQMYHHGYIDRDEYELAKTVQIVDLLNDPYKTNTNGDGIPYQAYIDEVINETIEITGLDPYTTTMHIYTYMNKEIQQVMDEIQSQTSEDYLAFPDDYVECASVCIDNSTGQVVGILGGRNYSNGGQLLLNHATEQYKQPGSSIKPILDYCLAFEYLGWSTDHVLYDVPMYMDSSKRNLVYNFTGDYKGDVTIKQAVGDSLNTCAIQTLQQVLDNASYETVVDYAQSLGYEFSLDDFNVQYGVGGSTCEVTPYQHAAAYAAIMNYGTYNEPHTVARIEFTNGKSPITPVYESTQVISEQAAYLTTDLMKSNVQSYGGSYSVVKSSDYQVYGKTGTTDWGSEGKEFGIPSGSNKDCWLIASTSEYTTATWVGYEKAVAGQPSYITSDYYYTRPQAKIAHLILDACYEYGENKPIEIAKPSGIDTITHIIGTWPYASINVEGVELDQNLITNGLIESKWHKLVSLEAPTIKYNLSSETTSAKILNVASEKPSILLNWTEYPDEEATKEVGDTKDISLIDNGEVIVNVKNPGKVLFDSSWVYGPVRYKAKITLKLGDKSESFIVSSDSNEKEVFLNDSQYETSIDIRFGATISIEMYYGYEKSDISSEVLKLEDIKQEVTTRTIERYSGSTINDAKKWCENNDIAFNYELVNSAYAEDFVVKDLSGNDYNYSIKQTNVLYTTQLTGTYYLYLDVDCSYDTSTRTYTLTPYAYNYVLNNLSWSNAFPDNYTITKSGNMLYITVPSNAKSATYNVDAIYNGYKKTITITIE